MTSFRCDLVIGHITVACLSQRNAAAATSSRVHILILITMMQLKNYV